jgi:hypothetical protein
MVVNEITVLIQLIHVLGELEISGNIKGCEAEG